MSEGDTGSDEAQYVSVDAARQMAREAAAMTAERMIAESNAGTASSEQDPLGYDKGLTSEIQKVIGLANAVKQLSSSPLHDAIERKVGDLAANVVEGAFSPGQSDNGGGGGGNGGYSIAASLSGAGTGSGAISVGVGGGATPPDGRVGDAFDPAGRAQL